jgi:hypothetical protein
MYTAEVILTRMRTRPFRPLRIIASEGLRFDIHYPDLVLVGRHDLTIGVSSSDHPEIYDNQTRVALVHIVALEDLPVPTISGNGQQGPTELPNGS